METSPRAPPRFPARAGDHQQVGRRAAVLQHLDVMDLDRPPALNHRRGREEALGRPVLAGKPAQAHRGCGHGGGAFRYRPLRSTGMTCRAWALGAPPRQRCQPFSSGRRAVAVHAFGIVLASRGWMRGNCRGTSHGPPSSTRRTILAGAGAATAALAAPRILRAQGKELVVGGAASHKNFVETIIAPVVEKKFSCKVVFEGRARWSTSRRCRRTRTSSTCRSS